MEKVGPYPRLLRGCAGAPGKGSAASCPRSTHRACSQRWQTAVPTSWRRQATAAGPPPQLEGQWGSSLAAGTRMGVGEVSCPLLAKFP